MHTHTYKHCLGQFIWFSTDNVVRYNNVNSSTLLSLSLNRVLHLIMQQWVCNQKTFTSAHTSWYWKMNICIKKIKQQNILQLISKTLFLWHSQLTDQISVHYNTDPYETFPCASNLIKKSKHWYCTLALNSWPACNGRWIPPPPAVTTTQWWYNIIMVVPARFLFPHSISAYFT